VKGHDILAEFADADALLDGVRALRAAGFGNEIQTFSPIPVDGLSELLGPVRDAVPFWTFLGGLCGGVGGFALQWFATVVSLPQDIGGRPDNSWPLYVPISFELAILGAALAAVVSMFAGNGLPRLRHPIFDAPDFDLASRNRFFMRLCLRHAEEGARARTALEALRPLRVVDVRG
jgi:hypothetical protein